jgi:hypothetical protein
MVNNSSLYIHIISTGENVVFVANDWHTAVLPCYLKSIYKQNGIYENAKVHRFLPFVGKYVHFIFYPLQIFYTCFDW